MSKNGEKNVVLNRRAGFDYQLIDSLTVGMALSGAEVRQIRDHHAQLKGAYVELRRGQLSLNRLTLGSETARNIPLLATKKQIIGLERAKVDGVAIVPVKIIASGRYLKLVISTGKGKKKYDKRATIKSRDIDRGRF